MDSLGCTGAQSFTVPVVCPTLTISPTSLSSARAFSPYSVSLTTTGGGSATYSYGLSSGSLPQGLSLSSEGLLSGTPTVTVGGSFPFTVLVTTSTNCQATMNYILGVCANITIGPLPNPTVGIPYSWTLSAYGGVAPYTFSVSSGSLPSGLTLSSSGQLSGTSTTAQTSSFTVSVTDSLSCSVQQSLTMQTFAIQVSISPTSLSSAFLDTTYSVSFVATGNITSPITWTEYGLPSGMSLSTGGVLSGVSGSYGNYTIGIGAIGADSHSATNQYNLMVDCSPNVQILPGNLTAVVVGQAYTQLLYTTLVPSYYSFSVQSGSLPSGLSLSSSGQISGTTQTSGNYQVTIAAQRSGSPCQISSTYSLLVCDVWQIFLSASNSAVVGIEANVSVILQLGNQQRTTQGFTLTVASGQLPAGLTLSSTEGAIVGVPVAAGTYTFTLSVTIASGQDAGCSATQQVTLAISNGSTDGGGDGGTDGGAASTLLPFYYL